jgi:hypothetical protein
VRRLAKVALHRPRDLPLRMKVDQLLLRIVSRRDSRAQLAQARVRLSKLASEGARLRPLLVACASASSRLKGPGFAHYLSFRHLLITLLRFSAIVDAPEEVQRRF